MKKAFIPFVLLLLCVTAFAEAQGQYPALGTCTGNGVRLREAPSTSSKILGKVDLYQELVLTAELKVKGELWYCADNPFDDGSAWISGRYIRKSNADPAFRTALNVRLSFGSTPKKTRMIFGRPSNYEREKFFFEPAQQNLSREVLTYPAFTVSFTEGSITRVEVTRKGYSFGEIQVGQEIQIVLDTLGKPTSSKSNLLFYEISPVESLTFIYESDRNHVDRLTRMCWEKYIDA